MKKKLLSFLLSFVLVISMTACANDSEKDDDDDVELTATISAEKPDDTEDITPEVTPEITPDPSDQAAGYEKGISVLSLDSGDEFDQYLNELYLTLVSTDDVSLHFSFENPEAYGIYATSVFPSVSDDNEAFTTALDKLYEFDRDKLTDSQKIKYDLLDYEIKMQEIGETFGVYYVYSLSQNGNFLSGLLTTLSEYSIQSEADAEKFVEVLEAFPDYMTAVQDILNDEFEEGGVITQTMLDYSYEMAENWVSDEISENPIYVAFDGNLYEAGLSSKQNEKYRESVADGIENYIYPAIEDYEKYLDSLDKYVVESTGLGLLEDGPKYYEWLMESYVGSGATIEELYDYMASKFDFTLGEIMDTYSNHPLKASTATLAKSKYGDEPEEVLKTLAEIIKDEFPDVGECDWILSYLPEAAEVDSVVAYFMQPQLDNIGRNIIRINGSNISDSVELFVTLAHEGLPGHLYQYRYAMSAGEYQEIDSALTYLSYSEGWAMYIEKKAYGWCLKDEIIADFLFDNYILNFELMTIVDMLVNYYGYNLNDVKEWGEETSLLTADNCEYLYEFAVSDPCLYPTYCLGYWLMQDTIDELVASGMTTMEAHDAVLSMGAAPYTVIWDTLGIKNPVTGK